jgi:putative membrane protein
MSERAFYRPETRRRITEAIKEVEAKTAAEVEVAIRRVSGRYREIDYLFGLGLAIAVLSVLLFHPKPWSVRTMPLDIAAAFAIGSVVCAHFWELRRRLVPPRWQANNVRTGAFAAFTELGVSRTHGRHGILVYVSLFERRVEVVPDIGIDLVALGSGWPRILEAMQSALRHHHDVDDFVEALRSLGPVLGAAMPHTPDSVNELPDEPDAR